MSAARTEIPTGDSVTANTELATPTGKVKLKLASILPFSRLQTAEPEAQAGKAGRRAHQPCTRFL
jgi:hypothetical protein